MFAVIRYFLVALFLIALHSNLLAYKISGKINLSDDWQPRVFLAAIHHINDYYKAGPDLIINMVGTDEEGHFVLEGANLPDEERFYRIYVMKEQNSEFDACLYMEGDDHNFIHLILDNDTQLEVIADGDFLSPFGNYSLKGNPINRSMRSLNKLIFPSFFFYQIKFPSELQYFEQKLNQDLLTFADTCTYSLVSLAAALNTDFDQYYDLNVSSYQQLKDRYQNDLKSNNYANDFSRKVRIYNPNDIVENKLPFYLISFLSLLSLIGLYFTYKYFQLKKNLKVATPSKDLSSILTNKELDILKRIAIGKSNKEIASESFIELSTVKTHINKIYSKLEIKDRKEAVKYGKSLI